MSEKIAVKRSTLLKIAVIIVLASSAYYLLNVSGQKKDANPSLQQIYNSLSPTGKTLFYEQSAGLTRDVDARLVYLDNLTISCGGVKVENYGPNSNPGSSCVGPGGILNADGTGPNLGGQCCGALTDVVEYEKHLEAMKKYSYIPDSPPDHFNVSVALVKKLIVYDRDTVLAAEQQKIYDDAIAMSEEGPCCCRCWHWYVNSGLAKEFIIVYNFTAEQVAQYWDESDICD
ncbi:MAG: hypothetical protein HY368_00225 [Candidatus Aenigmarchaeota archaeon]|nr:hypothetical protein [Candidatus Aenigmarchaeota archaeon]